MTYKNQKIHTIDSNPSFSKEPSENTENKLVSPKEATTWREICKEWPLYVFPILAVALFMAIADLKGINLKIFEYNDKNVDLISGSAVVPLEWATLQQSGHDHSL